MLRKLLLTITYINRIDRDTHVFGLQHAMRNLVKSTSSRLVTRGLNDVLVNILKNESAVIVANHPYEAETIALVASLPTRKDMYIIINNMFMGICPNADRYLIPVYIKHHRPHPRKIPIVGRLMDIISPTPDLSPEEERQKNIESIKNASKKITEGGLVIIFPGRRSPDGHWFHGVGYMTKGVGVKKNGYLVKVYITGTSNWDILRFIPGIGEFLPVIRVTFADAIKFKDIYNDNAKKITFKLEEDYNDWVDSLKLRDLQKI